MLWQEEMLSGIRLASQLQDTHHRQDNRCVAQTMALEPLTPGLVTLILMNPRDHVYKTGGGWCPEGSTLPDIWPFNVS